jgi:hypothetical protein
MMLIFVLGRPITSIPWRLVHIEMEDYIHPLEMDAYNTKEIIYIP